MVRGGRQGWPDGRNFDSLPGGFYDSETGDPPRVFLWAVCNGSGENAEWSGRPRPIFPRRASLKGQPAFLSFHSPQYERDVPPMTRTKSTAAVRGFLVAITIAMVVACVQRPARCR